LTGVRIRGISTVFAEAKQGSCLFLSDSLLRFSMIAKVLPIRVGLLAVLVAVSGCAGEPYVFNSEEFKRDTHYFVHGHQDRTVVEVCYHKRKATPAAVKALAVSECQRFGKTAAFTKTDYNVCPLTTPVAAVYECIGPKKTMVGPAERTGS
jgi:hypothetical protein